MLTSIGTTVIILQQLAATISAIIVVLQQLAATIGAVIIVLQQLAATISAVVIVVQQLAATIGAVIIVLQEAAACANKWRSAGSMLLLMRLAASTPLALKHCNPKLTCLEPASRAAKYSLPWRRELLRP